jgi:tRNA(fMet)-specific endonuclease VapC
MTILDTDVFTLIAREHSTESVRVRARIAQLPPDELVAPTIITYQEQTRGWLAFLGKARTKAQEVDAYARLASHLEDYREAKVVPYDAEAAEVFELLRRSHPRVGGMDLRIAAIALAHDAPLVTRNLKDFQQIEGLRVEDWTKP